MPIYGDESPAPYCTLDQARAAGAAGSDDDVAAAIASAEARVNRYTGELWTPTALQLAAWLSGDGTTALLHRRVRTVTAVRLEAATTDLPATAYRVTSSSMPGQVDAVLIGGQGAADALIAGAEPWRGGWAGYVARQGAQRQVVVTGTFGWDAPPSEVVQATAMLAAFLSGAGAGAADPGPAVDDEGNVVSVTTAPQPAAQRLARTTGLVAADQLLRPLQRRPVRLA